MRTIHPCLRIKFPYKGQEHVPRKQRGTRSEGAKQSAVSMCFCLYGRVEEPWNWRSISQNKPKLWSWSWPPDPTGKHDPFSGGKQPDNVSGKKALPFADSTTDIYRLQICIHHRGRDREHHVKKKALPFADSTTDTYISVADLYPSSWKRSRTPC